MTELSDQQVLDQRDDLEMLRRPHLWPFQEFPVRVYVKRPGAHETGPCIVWGRDPMEYIIQAHAWDAPLTPTPHATQRSEPGDHAIRTPNLWVLRYDSAEAILADGWVVD